MHSAYAPVPPVPRRRWHLLGPAIGAAFITTAGVIHETSRLLPPPVSAPATLPLLSVVETVAIGGAFGSLLIAWRRPVTATVLQAVAAVVLVAVGSIAPWGVAGPTVAALVAVGLHTAAAARARTLSAWPRVPSLPLDDAARRAVDHGVLTPRVRGLVARGLAVVVILVGVVWTAVDMARVHAFRTDPGTVTTTGRVLELLDDDLYATLDVDGTQVKVEILTAPPTVGDELPVRANLALDRAELLGTPFDPAGALVWSTLGVALLVALRHHAKDAHALATAARAAGTSLTLVSADDVLTLVDPSGCAVGRFDSVWVLDDPSAASTSGDAPLNPEAAAETEQILARLETLRERAADELDDDEILEVHRAESRLVELSAALDPRLEALLVDGARTDVVVHVVPATGDTIVRAPNVVLRSVVLSPPRHPVAGDGGRDPVSGRGAGADASAVDPTGGMPGAAGRLTGALAVLSRWLGDRDGLPMLALHAVVAPLAWWLLDEPGNGWWESLRAAIVPAYLLHLTWLVQPVASVRRAHLVVRERVLVQRLPWRAVTEITALDDTVIVRTLHDGTSDALVLGADPRSVLVPLAGCRDAESTAARLRAAWVAGRELTPPAWRWWPSLPMLLACAWAGLLIASAVV